MSKDLEKELLFFDNGKIQRDVSLSTKCTFKIGGLASYYYEPQDLDNFIKIIKICETRDIHYFVLGKGSNILFQDKGFSGLVISTKNLKGIKRRGDELEILCGTDLYEVHSYCQQEGLAGFEFSYGIPSTLGGAVYMNAGAYGGEMKDVVRLVTYYDKRLGVLKQTDRHEFSYRSSRYQSEDLVVLSAVISLEEGLSSEVINRCKAIMERRKSKQPLNYPSAGSIFKRPEGYFVGKLIQDCCLKGYSIGGAQVSEKHAGFIVNKGKATANDVIELIKKIKNEIKNKYDVILETEVKIID